VQFASKDTLVSRPDLCPPADLVVTDEAHRSAAETWGSLLARYPAAWEVGLTATPTRSDSRGLGARYEFLVQPTSYSELISAGVLVPARCYAPGTKVGVGGGSGGGKKAKRPRRADLVGDVVGWWERLAPGRRTFLFASSVAHSLALRDEFRARGVPAEHLDGSTPDAERDLVLGRAGSLARGETLVVCSCSVLKYGVDVPAVECVQIADGFGSLVDYLQACGRGLRAFPGKADCVVIDHSGCVLFHGFPTPTGSGNSARAPTTRGLPQEDAGRRGPAAVTCPECFAVYSGRPDCPQCGHRFARKGREVGTKSGTLHRVERDATPFAPEDLRKGWVGCVAVAHNTGRSLAAAAQMFRKRFGRPPWEVGAGPLPPSGYNWHTPATTFWRDAIAKAKSA
jgi:DNA repair protein RadD